MGTFAPREGLGGGGVVWVVWLIYDCRGEEDRFSFWSSPVIVVQLTVRKHLEHPTQTQTQIFGPDKPTRTRNSVYSPCPTPPFPVPIKATMTPVTTLGNCTSPFHLSLFYWLNCGDYSTAASFVALQSVPGLVILYAGLSKTKWAINSAFMAFYAFAATLIVWVTYAYGMGFGKQWIPICGVP